MYAAPADASLPKDVVATLKLIPPLPVEGAPLIFFPRAVPASVLEARGQSSQVMFKHG